MTTTGATDAARGGRSGMRRIVVSLLKGGVAKSETAVSLAHGMARQGLKVLLVDTDVQAQCNDMLGVDPKRGLADVIAGWTSPAMALAEARENLYLLAGGNDLAAVKMEIARREMAPEAVLDEALSALEEDFDVMVMDTAPGWDTLLVNALYASREVLSPVSMEPMALTGLIRFEERLAVIQKYNPRLALRWVVPTFVDGRVRKTGEIMAQLKERYGDQLAPPIKYSVKLSEAPAFGRTIYEHEPKGLAAQCYEELTRRVMGDLGLESVGPVLRPVAASRGVGASKPGAVAPPRAAAPRPVPAGPDAPAPEPEKVVALPVPAAASAPDPPGEPAPASPWPAPRVIHGLRARLEQEARGEEPTAAKPSEKPVLAGVHNLEGRGGLLEALARQGLALGDGQREDEEAGASRAETPSADFGLMDRVIKDIRQRLIKHGRP